MSWWENAVVYQVYPRSFVDSNGDGEGDLVGVRQRLDYLVGLGVDAVWLSPFYPSPMQDSGYDVADYCDVDPRFGTLGDFDELLAAATAQGLRVIVDIVPNHCSSAHPLFQAALAAEPGSPERDLFIFRDKPNNWPSFFGGSAWTQVPDGQYYLHLFDSTQPDWNWENPAVPAMFEDILRFWLDRGVAGFRVDVGNALYKAAGLPDVSPEVAAGGISYQGDENAPYQDQPELDEHYRQWRALLDSYGTDGFPGQRIMVGETWADDPATILRWVSTGMTQSFDFRLIAKPWSADIWQDTISKGLATVDPPGASPWAIGNHDVPRLVTRLGIDLVHELDVVRETLRSGAHPDLALGTARARAAALLVFGLPGSAYIYQGDELGLPEDIDIPDDRREDPMFFRLGGGTIGRDGCRVPLPWTGTAPPYGFTTGTGDTWLPQPADWATHTVEAQIADPASTYHLYREALRLRRHLGGDLTWEAAEPDLMAYRRGDGFLCIANFGQDPVDLPEHSTSLRSDDGRGRTLAGNSTAWLWT